jgi:hypothetical protein
MYYQYILKYQKILASGIKFLRFQSPLKAYMLLYVSFFAQTLKNTPLFAYRMDLCGSYDSHNKQVLGPISLNSSNRSVFVMQMLHISCDLGTF